MTISDTLLPLVVDEGQRACAEGVVVRTPIGLRIVTDDGHVAQDGCASQSVRLRAAEGVDLESLIGRDVVVVGTFDDGGLTVDHVEDRPMSRRRAKPLELGRPFVESGRVLQRGSAADVARLEAELAELAELAEVSAALREEGLITSFGEWRGTDGRLRSIATLLHVPTWLAERLSSFPADLYVLDVLVRPASAPGMPATPMPDSARR